MIPLLWTPADLHISHTHDVGPPSKPVWLLDVDGVINVSRPGWGSEPSQGRAQVNGVWYRLRWAPALTAHLTRIHRSGLAELRWCTTWVDHVEDLEQALGLPRLRPAFCGLNPTNHDINELKLRAAQRVIHKEKRHLIWTDDEAIPSGMQEEFNTSQDKVTSLLIAPDKRHGLQPADIESIEAFAHHCVDSLLAG